LVEESLRIQMSSISFGIGANAKSLKKKQKMQTLAEFAEPTDDHPAAFEFLSEQQREDEANALQVNSVSNRLCGCKSKPLKGQFTSCCYVTAP